jgi:hypothetical protein
VNFSTRALPEFLPAIEEDGSAEASAAFHADAD